MSDPFAAVMSLARAWFDEAREARWLDEEDVARLDAVEHGTPADLFVDQHARPLVVAFFGGTGVGKSSLLNRLAGDPIATTGIERPTSREATVYLHQVVELAELPPELPVDTVRIRRHEAAIYQNILWIDAPDIDSTEESNRRAALAWLPHVDLVCYVVSPERYRDDVGWRVLQQRGHKHGWMFVLNRWDEGDLQQAQDFAHMLTAAGFEDPLLLRTCCVPGLSLPSPDQFDELRSAIDELLGQHGVRELTRLGHRARLQELRRALQAADQRLGDDEAWEKILETLDASWRAAATTIMDGAEWSMRTTASRFTTADSGLLGKVRRGVETLHGHSDGGDSAPEGDVESHTDQLVNGLWDDWAQSKVEASLDTVELAVRRHGLSAEPVRRLLDAVGDSAGDRVRHHSRDHLRIAMAKPGTALSRLLRRLTGFLMAFLPAVALMCVAWAVVRGYWGAARGAEPFLGTAFAIHSILFILVAWAVPFTIDRLLRPSLERTALRAMRSGLQAGLDDLGRALTTATSAGAAEARKCREQGRRLITKVASILVKPIDARTPVLGRLMVQAQTEESSRTNDA